MLRLFVFLLIVYRHIQGGGEINRTCFYLNISGTKNDKKVILSPKKTRFLRKLIPVFIFYNFFSKIFFFQKIQNFIFFEGRVKEIFFWLKATYDIRTSFLSSKCELYYYRINIIMKLHIHF